VRLALGCDRHSLWRLAIFDQLRTVGIGAAVGIALAFAAGRLLSFVLPEISGVDPIVLRGSIVVLAATAAIAAAVPASRVLSINPLALLQET